MAKAAECKLLLYVKADDSHLAELAENSTEITRETFKKYVKVRGLKSLAELEAELGYENKCNGNLAKDNKMIRYWKSKFPDVNKTTLTYQHTKYDLYFFQE